MRAGTAEIKSTHGRAVIGIAEHRPRREQLVERERAVKDVPASQPELALEIERGEGRAGEDALPDIRRVAVDRRDDRVGSGLLRVVPAAALGELGIEVL